MPLVKAYLPAPKLLGNSGAFSIVGDIAAITPFSLYVSVTTPFHAPGYGLLYCMENYHCGEAQQRKYAANYEVYGVLMIYDSVLFPTIPIHPCY